MAASSSGRFGLPCGCSCRSFSSRCGLGFLHAEARLTLSLNFSLAFSASVSLEDGARIERPLGIDVYRTKTGFSGGGTSINNATMTKIGISLNMATMAPAPGGHFISSPLHSSPPNTMNCSALKSKQLQARMRQIHRMIAFRQCCTRNKTERVCKMVITESETTSKMAFMRANWKFRSNSVRLS